MNLGVRSRVFLVTLGLAILVGLPAGLLLEVRLRRQLVTEIEADLMRAAEASGIQVARLGQAPARIDDLADDLGDVLNARLTVVDPTGRVIGDSDVDGTELQGLENHENRPEIRAALLTGRGTSRRYSTTVRTDMLYVAVRQDQDGRPFAVVRAATPLSRVDAAIWQLRVSLLLGGGLALVLAAASGGLAATWLQQTLERLEARTRALAAKTPDMVPRAAASRVSIEELGRRLEKAVNDLAEERDQREAVLAAVADGVIAVDPDNRIVLLNAPARDLLGTQARLGSALSDLGDHNTLQELAERAQEAGEAEAAEVRWKGPKRVLEVTATPLRAGEGVVLVLHDLTRLRSLERVRRDFVANVSHELRTPVAVIAATTETLLDGAIDDPETAREFVQAVQRHAVRLGSLVGDLLSLARIESGSLPLEPENLGVGDAAGRAVRMACDRHPERRDDVHLKIDAEIRTFVDRSALDQVLGNLVENAVKYTTPGTSVCVRAGQDGHRTWIEVVDEGPGIPKKHRSRIFERFYRVDAGRSREMGGTGLGLAIVRHLTEAMGGNVDLRNNKPSGCVFRLDLPGPEAPVTTTP